MRKHLKPMFSAYRSILASALLMAASGLGAAETAPYGTEGGGEVCLTLDMAYHNRAVPETVRLHREDGGSTDQPFSIDAGKLKMKITLPRFFTINHQTVSMRRSDHVHATR